jgi:predicted MFS family arabinose efflux permease
MRYERGMEIEHQQPRGSSAGTPGAVELAAPLAASAEGSGRVAAPNGDHDDAPPSRRYRYYVLGTLVVVYTMNFLDRQILAILKGPIQAELQISNSVMGVMSGITFALLYSTVGIPIASWADRSSRRMIMAWALGMWSLFTAFCGLAQNIYHLALARIGVGIGEAGGVAPAYSMVSDYFPKHQRARALSIYSLGIPLGSAAGILFGGLIAEAISWRAAFLIVGGAGVVLAPLFYATVKDPKRGGWEVTKAPASKPKASTFGEVFNLVSRKKSFWLLALGAAACSICGYGVAFWLPSFLMTEFFPNDLATTSWYYAAITFVGGCLGILGGGIVADRIGGKSRSVYALAPAIAFVCALPCFLFAVNATSPWVALPLFIIPTGLNLLWLGPVLTAVQHLVPGRMRTTASAMFLLINNLLGIAVGYSYFGAVSDLMTGHVAAGQEMRYALYTGLGFYVVSATIFLFASRTLKRDWVDETTGEGVTSAAARAPAANLRIAIGAATVLGGLLLVALKLAAILALPWYAYVSALVAGIALFISGVVAPSLLAPRERA